MVLPRSLAASHRRSFIEPKRSRVGSNLPPELTLMLSVDSGVKNDMNVTFICLVPDVGHTIPLIKIAARLISSGNNCHFIAPNETTGVISGSSIECFPFGEMLSGARTDLLAAYLKMTKARRLTGHIHSDLERLYTAALRKNLEKHLPRIQATVSRTAPDLIVTDEFSYFTPHVLKMAQKLSVPAAMHKVHPACAANSDTIRFGTIYRDIDEWPQAVSDFAALVAGEVRLRKQEWLDKIRSRKRESVLSAKKIEDHNNRILFNQSRSLYKLGTGSYFLEYLRFRHVLKFENDRIILPLLPPVAGTQVRSRDLTTWLESGADDGNVVYISFGTMIGDASEITETLIRILLRNGKRVLVQACEGCPDASGSEERVRYESWLDQNAVLSHRLVDGIITHGGAGALQEAIWHAKPLICLPHAWDQYYNSWVIENLKIGVVGDKQRAKSRVYARKLLSRFFSEHAVLSQSIQELSDEARAFEKDFDLDGTFRAMA